MQKQVAFLFLLVFMISIAGSMSAFANGQKIRIVTEHYPPFEMKEPVNGLRGFDYDVVSEIFKRMGYEPDIVFLPWKRALREAEVGNAVGVLTCVYRDERAQYMSYSDPISEFSSGLFLRKSFKGPRPDTLENIGNYKTASIRNYESFAALKDAGHDPVAVEDVKTGIAMLLAERFDYLYLSKESTLFQIRGSKMVNDLEYHPITTKDFHFCFSKAYPDVEKIRLTFNKELAKLKASGEYRVIHSRYK